MSQWSLPQVEEESVWRHRVRSRTIRAQQNVQVVFERSHVQKYENKNIKSLLNDRKITNVKVIDKRERTIKIEGTVHFS